MNQVIKNRIVCVMFSIGLSFNALMGNLQFLTSYATTQEDSSNAIDDSIESYIQIDNRLSEIMDTSEYDDYTIEQRKEIIMDELALLEQENIIIPGSISYVEANQMIWYQWGNHHEAGIALNEQKNESFGYADTDKLVVQWYAKEPTLPQYTNDKIDFSDSDYPFFENDVVSLNLKLKYMADETAMSSDIFEGYESNKKTWGANHLSTTIDSYCTVEDYKTGLLGYNMVIFPSHGSYTEKNTPMICTPEKVELTVDWDSSIFPEHTLLKYNEDFTNNLIAPVKSGSDSYWWIYPKFFDYYYGNGKLKDVIIWISCCEGYMNSDLVDAFVRCGAKAVIAYTDTVNCQYDYMLHSATVYSLMWGDSVGEALQFAKKLYGDTDLIYVNKWVIAEGTSSVTDWHYLMDKPLHPSYAKISENGANAKLINLTPKPSQTTPYMTISNATKPSGTLTQGNSFGLRGVITSNLNITKVWGGVYIRNGSATAQYAEATPSL